MDRLQKSILSKILCFFVSLFFVQFFFLFQIFIVKLESLYHKKKNVFRMIPILIVKNRKCMRYRGKMYGKILRNMSRSFRIRSTHHPYLIPISIHLLDVWDNSPDLGHPKKFHPNHLSNDLQFFLTNQNKPNCDAPDILKATWERKLASSLFWGRKVKLFLTDCILKCYIFLFFRWVSPWIWTSLTNSTIMLIHKTMLYLVSQLNTQNQSKAKF